MATLIVEDGTILDGAQVSPNVPVANSYNSEAEFRLYYSNRNDAVAADSDSEAACAALLYAFDYMRLNWRERWVGSRVVARQGADWPRDGVPIRDFFDPYFRNTNVPFEFRNTVFLTTSEIPTEVKEAQLMLARASLTSATTAEPLLSALERATKREKLGDLEVEYFAENTDGVSSKIETIYADAARIVAIYMDASTEGLALRG